MGVEYRIINTYYMRAASRLLSGRSWSINSGCFQLDLACLRVSTDFMDQVIIL